MSTRDDILDQLKDDLENKLHSSDPNGYYTSDIAEVRRGVHHFEEAVNRPFIGFHLREDELDGEVFADTGNDQIRYLKIELYGYVEAVSEDYNALHALVRDIEYFFKYDFTYADTTTIGNIRSVEGGVRAPISYLDMEVQIQYMNEL